MITLEPFTSNDSQRLIEWIDTPKLMKQWAGWLFSYPLTLDQIEEYLKPALLEPPSRVILKACDDKTGQALGHIELNAINRQDGTGSICRVFVDPLQRNQGLGAAMVSGILEIAFGEYQLQRVDLQVFSWNEPAIRCYRKLGFVVEGVLRRQAKFLDEYWDLLWLSILHDEWEANNSLKRRTSSAQTSRRGAPAAYEPLKIALS